MNAEVGHAPAQSVSASAAFKRVGHAEQQHARVLGVVLEICVLTQCASAELNRLHGTPSALAEPSITV